MKRFTVTKGVLERNKKRVEVDVPEKKTTTKPKESKHFMFPFIVVDIHKTQATGHLLRVFFLKMCFSIK